MLGTDLVGVLPSAPSSKNVEADIRLKLQSLQTLPGQLAKFRMDDLIGKNPIRVIHWLYCEYQNDFYTMRRDLLSLAATRTQEVSKKGSLPKDTIRFQTFASFMRNCKSPFSTQLLTEVFLARAENLHAAVHASYRWGPQRMQRFMVERQHRILRFKA